MNHRSILSALFSTILLAALSGCAEEAAMQQPKGTTTAPHPTGANAPSRPSSSMGTSSMPGGTASKPATSGRMPQSLDPLADTSAGSQDDSMQACMARIPKDATAGQKMLAEESCKRDEANRK